MPSGEVEEVAVGRKRSPDSRQLQLLQVLRECIDVRRESRETFGLAGNRLAVLLDRDLVLAVDREKGAEQRISITAAVEERYHVPVHRRKKQRLVPQVEDG